MSAFGTSRTSCCAQNVLSEVKQTSRLVVAKCAIWLSATFYWPVQWRLTRGHVAGRIGSVNACIRNTNRTALGGSSRGCKACRCLNCKELKGDSPVGLSRRKQ